MIRRLRVQNFLCLKDTTVDLGPLTLLIGPNASGKSALCRAFVAISKLLHQFPVRGPQGEFNLEPGVTLDQLVWRGNAGLPISFHVWFQEDPDNEPGYFVELIKEARGWSVARETVRSKTWFDTATQVLEFPTERRGVQRFQAPLRATLSHLVYPYRDDQQARTIVTSFLEVAERYGFAWRYRPSASEIASFWRAPTNDEGQPARVFVGESGAGLPVVLQRLQGQDRPLFTRIEEGLHEFFPHIRFINFQSDRLGVALAFTTDRSEDLVPAAVESDGVLLTTFLLWRLFTGPSELKLCCLEEPENGTHPYLLARRYNLIKQVTQPTVGQPSLQVILSTHSTDFLNAIEDPEETVNVVRVVQFDPQQGTVVTPLAGKHQLQILLDAFRGDVGALWWTGAIGGVPSQR